MNADAQQTAIRAGWIIDGHGGPPKSDQLIFIENGRIASIVPAALAIPLPAQAMDLSHHTLLPALMDAHVHLALSGTLDVAMRKSQLDASPAQAAALVEQHLTDHQACGITALRDAGDKHGAALAYKKRSTRPHIFASCCAWHCAGRYGAMIGKPLDDPLIRSNAFADQIKGGDHIKLIQSGINSLDHFGRQTPPQFSADQMAAIARVARQHKLPLMVHANGEKPVALAIEAGCRSIEHGYFMGRENIKKMADRQIFWVPTAIPMAALIDVEALTPAQADVARQTLEHQLAQIDFARQQGVPIALGTDAGAVGVQHGSAVVQELNLLITAGLSLSQAISCATLNNTRLMGLSKRGAIQQGWHAEMIAVPGPPDKLLQNLNRVATIGIH